jgi:hypothetical protein
MQRGWMMDNAWLLAQRARMLSIEAEIQGMVALNQYRTSRGETIAYDDTAFQESADELMSIYYEIMKHR